MQSNFIEIALRHGCSPVYLLHVFRTPFLRTTSGWLLLYLYFLSKILTMHITVREGKTTIFILLNLFLRDTNNQLFFFPVFDMKWLTLSFNCNACNYQTATRWNLPHLCVLVLIGWSSKFFNKFIKYRKEKYRFFHDIFSLSTTRLRCVTSIITI